MSIGSLFGGASSQQTKLANEQSDLYNTLSQHYGTDWNQNQGFQAQLDAAWNPILAGGAYQYGFSVPEDKLLQSQIETQGAQQTTNTINAEELRQQQATGSASAGPSGGNEALEAMAAQQQAQSTAQSLAQEKLAGFQQGNTNFLNATNVKQGLLAATNPNAAGATAISGGEAAMSAQNAVTSANQNSLVGKLLQGAVQGAAGGLMPGGGLASLIKGSGNNGVSPNAGAPPGISQADYSSGIGNTFSNAFPPTP